MACKSLNIQLVASQILLLATKANFVFENVNIVLNTRPKHRAFVRCAFKNEDTI